MGPSNENVKQNRLLSNVIMVAVASLWLTTALAQVNAPTDLQVVPRYDGGSISLVLNWTDNSHGVDNEQGFQIQAREVGGTFTTIANNGVNDTEYEDTTATGDKWWEYRVKASHAVLGDSTWSNTSAQNSPRQAWPIHNGEHNVLYTHAQPISAGGNYFHGGTDISGNGNQVDVARGGIVAVKNNNVGGTLEIDIDYGADGTYRDRYWHTVIDSALRVGDNLVVGTKVGDISTSYFTHADEHHLHWGLRWHNLAKFTGNQDRDPNNTAPVVADTNGDGDDFIVVDAATNDHTNPREPAWGEVDFLVDAYDDMTPGNNNRAAPLVTGYWIQAGIAGGENVRNATDYYRLLNFNMERTSYSGLTGVEGDVVYTALPGDLLGANIWGTFLTWIPTNAGDTDGALGNVDAGQFWKTDARKGTGTEPNGSDADKARENQEARFPDGTYFVHFMLEDFVHTSDTVRSVLVDNSRPYAKRLTVLSGTRIVYQAQWVWDGSALQLELQPATFDAAAPFTALRTQDITVEVEFSEPMANASVTAITPSGGASDLGVTLNLTSTDPAHAQTVWRALISNLDIADDGSHDGTHMLTLDGTDLAGNTLLQINTRAAMGADHHNRDAAGIMRGTAGNDTIHGFRIGPLSGVIPVTAIFMKQGAADPPAPTTEDRALALQNALNSYFDEVSYDEISFAVTATDWYQLQQPLDWYQISPRTPLVDLIQEAITHAETNGVALDDYVLVVTDENVTRTEWSTHGAWPYTVVAAPGWRLLASGTLNAATTDARLTNLAGRMVGLIDLFRYPEVSYTGGDFVGPWSHMSDQDTNVHVLGWEKWRVGWVDETGTATGKTLTRVAKPSVGAPITAAPYTISAMDSDTDAVKMVAIEIGDRLHYTAEYRRQQNLDAALPNAGVVILKANDYVNFGEGPAIIQESNITAGNLNDAPFTTTAPRDVFNDVGSGVTVSVVSINANEASISLDYTVPPTENDVFVSPHDRWKADDIWVDAPDPGGNFEADPLTVIDANELPVPGQPNKVYGRVRNQGHADATNFELHLDIHDPWGTGGPWTPLNVKTVPLLQGRGTNPAGDAYDIVEGTWTPSGNPHACVQLTVHGVANDGVPDNNWTQENFSEFDATRDSPYAPVTTRFDVENPYDEQITVFFKLDGIPPSWSYTLSPERLTIPARGVGDAQVTLHPHEGAPVCSKEVVTVSAYTPRVDTLKELGGITMQIGMKNSASVDAESWVQCGESDPKSTLRPTHLDTRLTTQQCYIHTRGCTEPPQPNIQVAILYTLPDGSVEVRYVMTDENGCYVDTVTAADAGRWETEVVVEGDDCTEDSTAPPQTVNVPPSWCGGVGWCCWLWIAFLIAVIVTLLWFARWRCDLPKARLPFLIFLALTMVLGWLLLSFCALNMVLFWLSLGLAVIIALLLMCWLPFVPCIGRWVSG